LMWNRLDYPPLLFGLKNIPVPSSSILAKQVYPSSLETALQINIEFNLGLDSTRLRQKYEEMWPLISEFEDQPDHGLVGPF